MSPPNVHNIVLIGYRGAGKSSVARLLAERLSWPVVDSDDLVEQRAGMPVADIFAQRGETAFRDLESAAVAHLAAQPQTIIAVGGGAVLRPANREALARSLVIWLQAPASVLAQRMTGDPATQRRRPPLTAAGPLAEIEQVLSVREPIYRQCAQWEVNTTDKTPDEVVQELHRRLQRPLE